MYRLLRRKQDDYVVYEGIGDNKVAPLPGESVDPPDSNGPRNLPVATFNISKIDYEAYKDKVAAYVHLD